jgi:hypothetical protein
MCWPDHFRGQAFGGHISLMINRTPGLPLSQLLQRLQQTVMSGRHIRAFLHDSDFRAIRDRNSQMLFLREFAADQCFVSVNGKTLAKIYHLSRGNVKTIRCNARRRQQNPSRRLGRPSINHRLKG